MINITPPSELVQEWAQIQPVHQAVADHWQHITACAAQWGADQELEACCEYLVRCAQWEPEDVAELRAAQRPKPPSLKEQALEALEAHFAALQAGEPTYRPSYKAVIRRALESISD
jgi:hypothetical protein